MTSESRSPKTELHDVAAVASCSTRDSYGLARLQSKLNERLTCRESVHRQRRRLDMGGIRGCQRF